ncbi:MAG: organic hydroperoxide resistance protein [Clostridiaceae bacterium]|jgi:osmotically inducible protein OsmC|nr:organic hydroperoxide resistance protein [Clostridiaceae bacterium]
MEVIYKIKAVSTIGRNGKVVVENSALEFEMSPPVEMGGQNNGGANPEQLFAAGYAACFGSALQHVIREKKLPIPTPSVEVTVGIGKDESGGFELTADITGLISGVSQEEADRLVQEAHNVCPYSKATRGNIQVNVSAKAV